MAKKNQEVKNEQELFEVEGTEVNKTEGVNEMENELNVNEMELELEMDGEELQAELEEVVENKVKQEEKQKQESKSKRGPKEGSSNKKKDNAEGTEKEDSKNKINLSDANVVQREIKKGRISAPQARIEKVEGGDYKLLLAPGVIFAKDAKDKFEDIGTIKVMNDGKYQVAVEAVKKLGTENFKAQHENGEEVEHDWVRVELHKPGRDKDVVQLHSTAVAKKYVKELNEKMKRKQTEDAKKAEKAAKEKAEKEKADKEPKVKEEKTTA